MRTSLERTKRIATGMARRVKKGASRVRLSPDLARRGWAVLRERRRAIRGVLRIPRLQAFKTAAVATPKPPPPLPHFFMLSHLADDGPVRLDRVKVGVCEVLGLELDEPKLGAFAGALNAADFQVQLLVRQHPPGLARLRADLAERQPEELPAQAKDAADSLQRLLTELETRDGILDRRFYAVCEYGRSDELRSLLAKAGLSVHPLTPNPPKDTDGRREESGRGGGVRELQGK